DRGVAGRLLADAAGAVVHDDLVVVVAAAGAVEDLEVHDGVEAHCLVGPEVRGHAPEDLVEHVAALLAVHQRREVLVGDLADEPGELGRVDAFDLGHQLTPTGAPVVGRRAKRPGVCVDGRGSRRATRATPQASALRKITYSASTMIAAAAHSQPGASFLRSRCSRSWSLT